MEQRPLAKLSGSELAAVAELWKRDGRVIESAFAGSSMLPSIAPGTVVRIACGGVPAIGEVLLLAHRGFPVVHRMIAGSPDGRWILTRGDANAVPDVPVGSEAVIGVAQQIRAGNAWNPIPSHRESRAQRLYRVIGAALLPRSRTVTSLLVRLLFRIHGAASTAAAAWWRYGLPGFAARMWSRTGGRLVDVDLVFTGRFRVEPFLAAPEGYRFERVEADSPLFVAAAGLLRVDPGARTSQEAFVAIDSPGTVAAAAFADRPAGTVGFNRGVATDERHRGRALAASLLRFQAAELGRRGVLEVEYHVSGTNRAARRMFQKIGARETERWIILVLARRFRFSHRTVLARPR